MSELYFISIFIFTSLVGFYVLLIAIHLFYLTVFSLEFFIIIVSMKVIEFMIRQIRIQIEIKQL